MASSNMIVTLAMNATKYASGLRTAAGKTTTFGSTTTRVFNLAKTAFLGLAAAAIRYIPILANMGAESRKADIQLRFMLENMQGISKATDATVKRMAAYADQVNVATGIDDEQIKAVQRKLLVFKSLRETADDLGGTFDRTTAAAIDLAAGGFGDMEANAIKLGRVLENPTANLNALTRAGITFTAAEKAKITRLQESGRLLKAQDVVLKSIEKRVMGLAEKSATPFEKMTAQFNQIGDAIGEAMLPALEDVNKQISQWLSTPQGRRDVDAIAEAFISAAYAIRDMARFMRDFKQLLDNLNPNNLSWFRELVEFNNNLMGNGTIGGGAGGNNGNTGNTGGGGGGGPVPRSRGGVVINFNSPVDSVSAGREVARVLADFNRANGARR